MNKNIQFLLLFIICFVGTVNAQISITFSTKTNFNWE